MDGISGWLGFRRVWVGKGVDGKGDEVYIR